MPTIHPPKAFYIVSRVNAQGDLEPATHPRKYASFEQGRAVAYRLAEESGEVFVVLEANFIVKPVGVAGVYMEA